MLSSIDIADDRWFRILARWSLLAGITYLGLLLVFFIGVFPLTSSSTLPEDYNELVLATTSAGVSRISVLLALTYWVMIGGFLTILAVGQGRRGPVRSILIALCGIGQLIGAIGNILQLNGVSALASHFAAGAPDQQAAVLRSFSDLRLVYTSEFEVSGILWAVGLLLLAWVTWSLGEFPRWLTGLATAGGVVGLAYFVVMIVMGRYEPPVPGEILLMILFFATAATYWRTSPVKQSAAV